MSENNYLKHEYFYNRELSWISFNYRVLSEAQDSKLPLLDRLRFLAITASNLDEFFMIRVASLKDMVHVNYTKKDIAGMTPGEQLLAISKKLMNWYTNNMMFTESLSQNLQITASILSLTTKTLMINRSVM